MNFRAGFLFVFIAFCIFLSVESGYAGQAECKIAKFSGTVEVLPPGKDTWHKAKAGETLAEGAQVKTGAKSEAYLSFGGGHSVKVSPMSLMKVSFKSSDSKPGNNLQVSRGKIHAKVSKLDSKDSFNVKTPTAVAGVRGTKFSVEVTPGNGSGPAATLTKIKGKVEVKKAKASKWVAAKDGTKAAKGDAVRSGADGTCVLAWGKGNVAIIKPMSQITVSELAGGSAGGKNELAVSTGKTLVNAKKLAGSGSSFNVKTPTAVAGVRGTKFGVSVAGGDPTRSAGVTGKLKDVKGTVEVLEKSGGAWKKATNNMAVKTGDTVRTKANGSCVVTWAKGNVVRVSPYSSIKLNQLSTTPATGGDESELYVSSGKVSVKAKKLNSGGSFTVKTPTAVAGVRGTKFSVKVEEEDSAAAGGRQPAKTEVACVEGEVAVASENGGEVSVSQGEKTGIAAGAGPTAPEQMSQQEIDEFNSEAGLDDPAYESADAGDYPEEKPGETEVRCAQGELEVTSPDGGANVTVGAGEKTTVAENGQPSAATEMTPDELNEINSAGELDDPGYLEMGSAGVDGDAPSTEIQVLEGLLEVASTDGGGGQIELAAGMKMSVDEGQAPQDPAMMSADEIDAFLSESAGIELIESGALDTEDSGRNANREDDAAADVMDIIDAALENNVLNDIVDSAQPVETFDIDVDLLFQ